MADIISVSALNKYVRSVLESDVVLTDIAIRGEISNFSRHYKTGHCYFTLKDDKASVKAVMFRSDAQELPFSPENGMQVVARGRITLYERDGAFQINAEHLFMDGEGAAQRAFLQLKERLEKEGLFDASLKKPLTAWPAHIGLVTSKTGAALQDILKVAQRRYPLVRFTLAPVSVQGQRSVPEIIHAVQQLAETPGIDLILIARGGGSAEDLWVFNAEELARAVFACQVPVVSAIGHEIDFTILDFVADLRAPTPSAAAEMVLPDMVATHRQTMNIFVNISNKMQERLDLCYNDFNRSVRQLQYVAPGARLQRAQKRLAVASQQAIAQQAARLARCTQRLASAAGLAESLSPYAVLARGYSVVNRQGRVLRSVDDCQPGDALEVVLRDGRVEAVAKLIQKEALGHEKG